MKDGIVLILASIAIFYIGFKFRLKARKILLNGVEVKGTVFDIVGSGITSSLSRYPIVRFLTKENVWITQEYDISTTFNFLKKGQEVTVLYNPDAPNEFFIKTTSNNIVPILTIMIGIIVLSIGVLKLYVHFQ